MLCVKVRKLMLAGYDMQQVTGDIIGKADYIKAQKEVTFHLATVTAQLADCNIS